MKQIIINYDNENVEVIFGGNKFNFKLHETLGQLKKRYGISHEYQIIGQIAMSLRNAMDSEFYKIDILNNPEKYKKRHENFNNNSKSFSNKKAKINSDSSSSTDSGSFSMSCMASACISSF